jgi:hypothetical protein
MLFFLEALMNCKPGDLALVVRSTIPENLGKIVHVMQAFNEGDLGVISLDKGHLWLCEAAGSPLLMRGALSLAIKHLQKCPIPDHCLRPLRPGEDVDDNASTTKLHTAPEATVA